MPRCRHPALQHGGGSLLASPQHVFHAVGANAKPVHECLDSVYSEQESTVWRWQLLRGRMDWSSTATGHRMRLPLGSARPFSGSQQTQRANSVRAPGGCTSPVGSCTGSWRRIRLAGREVKDRRNSRAPLRHCRGYLSQVARQMLRVPTKGIRSRLGQ